MSTQEKLYLSKSHDFYRVAVSHQQIRIFPEEDSQTVWERSTSQQNPRFRRSAEALCAPTPGEHLAYMRKYDVVLI